MAEPLAPGQPGMSTMVAKYRSGGSVMWHAHILL